MPAHKFPDFFLPGSSPAAPAPCTSGRPDRLKDGLAWLTGQLRDFASQCVTYARGYDSVDVPATLGRQLLKLDDGAGGVVLEWTDLDLCVPTAGLDFGFGAVTPERGDQVFIVVGAEVQEYQVLPYGAGESVWRWSDPHQSMRRIHAKFVSSEPYS